MTRLAVLAVFCSKLSAIEISFFAEILGRRRFGEQKNSLVVLLLFSAVLVKINMNCEYGTSVVAVLAHRLDLIRIPQ
jgi:hypothetical protein